MTKTLLPICPTTVSFTVYPRLNAKGLLLISALIWGTPIGVGRLLPWGAFSRERLTSRNQLKKSTRNFALGTVSPKRGVPTHGRYCKGI